jgi:hypothetical protein
MRSQKAQNGDTPTSFRNPESSIWDRDLSLQNINHVTELSEVPPLRILGLPHERIPILSNGRECDKGSVFSLAP